MSNQVSNSHRVNKLMQQITNILGILWRQYKCKFKLQMFLSVWNWRVGRPESMATQVVMSNLYDFTLCSIKIIMQKLIMKMSLLVGHRKAQSLPFQTKFVSCKSGEYFRSYALTIFLT